MKNQQLERARELLDSLSQDKGKMFKKGNWDDFGNWLDLAKNRIRFKGIKRSSIEGLIFDFERIVDKLDDENPLETDQKNKLEGLDKHEKKALVFKEAVKIYREESVEVDPFAGKTWYGYFFHVDDREKEPKLGRIVIRGDSSGYVEIENLPGLSHKNYGGHYINIHNQACFLDLEAESRDRKLHIKVYYSVPRKDKILLGSYITFESNNHIVTGAIVLEPATGDNITSAILSYKDNPEIFQLIHPAIRAYLLFKKYNYQRTPRGIHNYDDLDRFLLRHSKRENWESRFLEEATPSLFIASPGLSLNKETFDKNTMKIDGLVSKLKAKFSGWIDITIHNNQKYELDPVYPETLVNLKKSRFFVLIYTKTDIGSYSLVQLGWAMAHCKFVMMFYEEGSISDHVLTLPQNVLMQSFQDLEKGIDNIYNTIDLQIRRNL